MVSNHLSNIRPLIQYSADKMAGDKQGSGFKKIQIEPGIRQAGPARWEVQVHVGRDPLTGKLCQVSRTTRDGIRAARKLRAEMTRSPRATPPPRRKPTGVLDAETYGCLLDEWLAHCKHRSRSPNTIAGRRWEPMVS
jgi:hypothetical protein